MGRNKSLDDFKSMDKYSNDEVKYSGLYAAQVLLRMDTRYFLKQPTQASKQNMARNPDLVLWIDESHLDRNIDSLNELRLGDVVSFTGYIRNLKVHDSGRNALKLAEDEFPHVQVFDIKKKIQDFDITVSSWDTAFFANPGKVTKMNSKTMLKIQHKVTQKLNKINAKTRSRKYEQTLKMMPK